MASQTPEAALMWAGRWTGSGATVDPAGQHLRGRMEGQVEGEGTQRGGFLRHAGEIHPFICLTNKTYRVE